MSAPRQFYTGTHKVSWLWNGYVDFPLMVSHRWLSLRKTLKPAVVNWALDSGGFTELSTYGEWRVTPREYVEAVARYVREIGRLDWAAPQDWMCEDAIINGGRLPSGQIAPGTHLSVEEHQDRTVANFLELRGLWPEYSDAPCPFIPVIQGDPDDAPTSHIKCVSKYGRAVRLNEYPVVGIGSVCRQQGNLHDLFRAMRIVGRPHGFGVKMLGLQSYGHELASADSLAWSFDARRSAPLPGHSHSSCANCPEYAALWRERLLAA